MARLALAVLSALVVAVAANQFYPFSSSVAFYSKLDLDIRDMEIAADKCTFGPVNFIFNNGKYAKPRTIKSLSAPNLMAGEPIFNRYRAYWGGNGNYANKIFLDGSLNRYAPKRPCKFRAEVPVKGAQYISVWMWVIHKMERSIKACVAKRPLQARQQLDQAVADYRGSVILRNLNNDGYMLHTLAEKRCANFVTCQGGKTRGPAIVNLQIYAQLRNMKRLLNNGQCARARFAKNRIVRLMHVPLVQGCLRYMSKTTQAKAKNDVPDRQKSQAEGWMFCAAVLPSINKCNKSVAALIRRNFDPKTQNPMFTPQLVLSRRLQSTYKCLGITCKDVGNLVEGGKKLLGCA